MSDFWVSPRGNDQNNGTELQPWQTIAAAQGRAKAGDTVTLADGTWTESLRPPSGTIWKARNAGQAILSGASAQKPTWAKDGSGIWRAAWPGSAPNGLWLGTFETAQSFCCCYDGRYAMYDPSRPGGQVVAGSKSQWDWMAGQLALTTISGGAPNDEGLQIATGNIAITLDGLSDVHLDGIVTRCWRAAVSTKGGRNLVLTSCYFGYNAQTGVWLTGIDGAELTGCRIQGAGSLLGHYEDTLHCEAGRAKVSGCELSWGGHGLAFCQNGGAFSFSSGHLHDSGGSGITLAVGVNDCVIDGNWIARCATQRSPSVRDVGAALQLHGDRHRVTNNHLEKNSKHVLCSSTGPGTSNPSTNGLMFERNTMLSAEESGVEYQEAGPSGSIANHIWNDNIIMGAGLDILSLWFAGAGNHGLTHRFNRSQIGGQRIRGTLGTFATVEEAARANPAVYVNCSSAPIPGAGSTLTSPPDTSIPPVTPPPDPIPPPDTGKPILASLTPSSGPAGTTVRGEGTGLTGADMVVATSAGSTRLTGLAGTATAVTFAIPANGVTGPVYARTAAGRSNEVTFTVTGVTPPDPPPAGITAQVVALVNQERAKVGAGALTVNAHLMSAAAWLVGDMQHTAVLSHTGSDGSGPADRIARAGYSAMAWGEVAAQGYRGPAEVVAGWMASPTHHAILMNSVYTEIGVGYAEGAWWAADLATPSGTPVPVPPPGPGVTPVPPSGGRYRPPGR